MIIYSFLHFMMVSFVFLMEIHRLSWELFQTEGSSCVFSWMFSHVHIRAATNLLHTLTYLVFLVSHCAYSVTGRVSSFTMIEVTVGSQFEAYLDKIGVTSYSFKNFGFLTSKR